MLLHNGEMIYHGDTRHLRYEYEKVITEKMKKGQVTACPLSLARCGCLSLEGWFQANVQAGDYCNSRSECLLPANSSTRPPESVPVNQVIH